MQSPTRTEPAKPAIEKPLPVDPQLVRAFVASAHGNLDKVQALLAQEPGLLHAAWDWGGGDWETAIGAAAHVGRRDIAEFLLGKGARLNLFAAAMLGHLEVVRAIVVTNPAARDALGPHRIGLLAHAKAGGEPARAVVEFLEGTSPPDAKIT